MWRIILLPFAWIYGIVLTLRHLLFDWGILSSSKFEQPIIVIGNLSLGGTGKSPHTLYLAHLLSNYKTAILSRGYRRQSKGFRLVEVDSNVWETGDEPLMFKRSNPEVMVSVCEDRCEGIRRLNATSSPPNVILLDDAYQHRKLQPGLSVLLFDYKSLNQPSFLIPAGNRRDVMNRWKKADIILITKSPERGNYKELSYRDKFKGKEVFFSRYEYKHLLSFDGKESPLSIMKDKSIVLVTGIADSNALKNKVEEYAKDLNHMNYDDHHDFTQNDIVNIQKNMVMFAPEKSIYLTTSKDRTRLISMISTSEHKNWFSIEIGVEIDESEKFDKLIVNYVERTQRNRFVH